MTTPIVLRWYHQQWARHADMLALGMVHVLMEQHGHPIMSESDSEQCYSVSHTGCWHGQHGTKRHGTSTNTGTGFRPWF